MAVTLEHGNADRRFGWAHYGRGGHERRFVPATGKRSRMHCRKRNPCGTLSVTGGSLPFPLKCPDWCRGEVEKCRGCRKLACYVALKFLSSILLIEKFISGENVGFCIPHIGFVWLL